MKIYVIGPSGSGKTTLSKVLSKKYNTDVYELDCIVYDDEHGHIKYSDKEIDKEFNKIIKKDSWVIEDVGRDRFKKGFEEADIIYYLNLSEFKVYQRDIKRWINQKLGREKYNYPPTVFQFFDTFRVTRHHFKNKKEKLEKLKKYKDKVVYLSKKDVDVICNTSLRNLKDQEEDYKYLYKWYQIKDVYEAFEQRSLSYEEIVNKYKTRTKNNSSIKVLMIEYKDNPIGIVQYQKLSKENKALYNIDDDNVYEIDIFIGNIKYHSKGIGKEVINEITEYLFREIKAGKIVMCPLLNNKKAINCYKRCGYREKRIIKAKDTIGNLQEYQLMMKDRK